MFILTYIFVFVGFFSRNHESKSCKSGYGFKNEVEAKYDEDSYKKCLECFKKLPLASWIGQHVFTTHGGLFLMLHQRKGTERMKIGEPNPYLLVCLTIWLKLKGKFLILHGRRTVQTWFWGYSLVRSIVGPWSF